MLARIVLAREARGHLVETLQRGLGFRDLAIDGVFGGETESAVALFQRRAGLSMTGFADPATWQQATHQSVPELFERALQLTAGFEGHGFTRAQGNFDGAGITWGIIGFTLASGGIAALVREIHQPHPECLTQAFGDLAPQLLKVVNAPMKEQLQFADSLSAGPNKISLAEPWRSRFELFGAMEAVKQTQLRYAREKYFAPALLTARRLGLRTELGIGLAFDIHVQNGGVPSSTATALLARHFATERDVRVELANAIADSAHQEYRDDVRRRKLTLATGAGTVHGVEFILRNWGLDEVGDAGSDVVISPT